MLGLRLSFARELPALCDSRGVPLSWRHFRYGLEEMERAHSREALRIAGAVGIAMASDPAAREQWFRLHNAIAYGV
ncbi:MAG: hypothetical protein LC667_07020 [Thioalkalivibrio sp.]|nr:hypothetical protein [Thioalkalivibrio sp.]